MTDKSKCADCGVSIPTSSGRGRPKVRCAQCANKRSKIKRSEWYATAYDGYEQTCKQCGVKFKHQAYRAHCSEACATAYLEGRKRKATCKKCGVVFRPKQAHRWQYCSRACAYADIKTWYNAGGNIGEKRYSEIRFKKCVVCNSDFTTNTPSQMTCLECAEKLAGHNVTRAKRPSKSHISRAKEHGVQYEKFDPLLVFERDGWVCQICGISTPLSKRGTYDDDAPELDHIIPLSKGGGHLMSNSQCSCKKCNREKRDTV